MNLNQAYQKAITDEDIAYDMPNKPSDFYGVVDWEFKTEQERTTYLNTLSPEGKEYMRNWVAAYENRVNLKTEYFNLVHLVSDGIIAKKYGFWDNPAATTEEKKIY